METINVELENEVIEALGRGRKIEAIKKLRALRGIGLKEAKQLVELYAVQNKLSCIPPVKAKSSNSLLILIILAIGCYFFYQQFS